MAGSKENAAPTGSATGDKQAVSKTDASSASDAPGNIEPIAYRDSVGARSMQDTPRHIAERNHYNYVDVEMRGDTFDGIDPHEHAALKHHSTILLYGMRQADALSEIYKEAAALLKPLDDRFDNPVWLGFFRHVRNIHDKPATDAFLASCLGTDEPLESFDWQSMPEFIRSEWILYNWRWTAGIAPQAADEETLRQWVKDPTYQTLVLFGLMHTARIADDIPALGHYLNLLNWFGHDIYNLSEAISTPDMFLAFSFRQTHIRRTEGAAAAVAFLNDHWDRLVTLKAADISPKAHLARLKSAYGIRLEAARDAGDTASERLSHEQWRTVLEAALEKFQAGDLS